MAVGRLKAVRQGFATLRMMREGMRFAYRLPTGPRDQAATATNDHPNALETYFDSIESGPGITKWRHYFPIYTRHLAKFIGKPLHLVEIGVFGGGSMPMWRAYLGQECRVSGVDIDPGAIVHEEEGIEIFIGDQADPNFWNRFLSEVPPIDVVIDDGGHEDHQQIQSLVSLLPEMRMGGVYICEDLHSEYNQFHSFVEGVSRPLSHITHDTPLAVHQHIASVHRYPALTVIEKPEGPVESFDSSERGTEWPE